MDKQLIMDICDKLDTDVPALKTIDIDFGQLTPADRPGVAFPCCLVDVAYGGCKDTDGQSQQVTATITLRIAHNAFGKTSTKSPQRSEALAAMDMIRNIHASLQGWDNNGSFDPLTRTSAAPEKRSDGLRVFRITYQAQFIDSFDI